MKEQVKVLINSKKEAKQVKAIELFIDTDMPVTVTNEYFDVSIPEYMLKNLYAVRFTKAEFEQITEAFNKINSQ